MLGWLWRKWAKLCPRSLRWALVPYWIYLTGFVASWLEATPENRAAVAGYCFGPARSRYTRVLELAGSMTFAFRIVLGTDYVPRESERERFATPEMPADKVTLAYIIGGSFAILRALRYLPDSVRE